MFWNEPKLESVEVRKPSGAKLPSRSPADCTRHNSSLSQSSPRSAEEPLRNTRSVSLDHSMSRRTFTYRATAPIAPLRNRDRTTGLSGSLERSSASRSRANPRLRSSSDLSQVKVIFSTLPILWRVVPKEKCPRSWSSAAGWPNVDELDGPGSKDISGYEKYEVNNDSDSVYIKMNEEYGAQ